MIDPDDIRESDDAWAALDFTRGEDAWERGLRDRLADRFTEGCAVPLSFIESLSADDVEVLMRRVA